MTPTDDEAAALIDDAFSEKACAAAVVMDPVVLHHPHRFSDGTIAPLHIELKVIPSEELPIESIPSVVSLVGPLATAIADGRFEDVGVNSFTCPIMISAPDKPHDIMSMKVSVVFGTHVELDGWELTAGIIMGYIINSTLVALKADASETIEELTTRASIITLEAVEPVIVSLHHQLGVTTQILSTRFSGMTLAERNSWQEAALVTATLGHSMEKALANVARTITAENESYLSD